MFSDDDEMEKYFKSDTKKFIDSVENGRYDEVKNYLENGTDANTIDFLGVSAIELAVKSLVDNDEYYSDEDESFDNDEFGTYSYRFDAYISIIELLLKHGAEIDKSSSILHPPIESENVALVKYLLEKGANPNVQNGTETTALTFAASECRSKEIIELLLKFGADKTHKDCEGNTALDIAILEKNLNVIKVLQNN